MTYNDIEATHVRMLEIRNEAETMLAMQRLAAGDDTHYFRRSLIEFYKFLHPLDSKRDAVAVVDGYIRATADSLTIRDRVKMRFRRVVGGVVDRRATPAELAAAWTCFVAGMRAGDSRGR